MSCCLLSPTDTSYSIPSSSPFFCFQGQPLITFLWCCSHLHLPVALHQIWKYTVTLHCPVPQGLGPIFSAGLVSDCHTHLLHEGMESLWVTCKHTIIYPIPFTSLSPVCPPVHTCPLHSCVGLHPYAHNFSSYPSLGAPVIHFHRDTLWPLWQGQILPLGAFIASLTYFFTHQNYLTLKSSKYLNKYRKQYNLPPCTYLCYWTDMGILFYNSWS